MPREHKALPRLFIEPALTAGGSILLGREQTNYLVNVLRMGEGDAVVVFNGRDGAWLARIVRAGKKEAVLEAVVQTAHQTPPSDLWFGFAPLKTGRLDYLVQKATEMGAGTIQPVLTKFTQVSRLKADKLAAYALEAAEQCEVLSLPRIAPEIGLATLIGNWRTSQGLRRLLFADEAAASSTPVEPIGWLEGLPVGILIGPEGGFSGEERALLLGQDFVVPISLGPRILRADTAAVAALALVQAIIGDWR
ncbi:MAG: 16S rRNA (uracil(1498)-N(3))-methyltransferase [Devosia nanyangense]|uniref:Ribosomal RNA small subunit methyltransferase E n=1 Tax=Devosia nanyangense TaxID=1228055 RepID=A0A933KY60_9HYPH|nr:16S rRNA (uracil(1498)-N(3))-methyltransferase [Devosia nanyangense]